MRVPFLCSILLAIATTTTTTTTTVAAFGVISSLNQKRSPHLFLLPQQHSVKQGPLGTQSKRTLLGALGSRNNNNNNDSTSSTSNNNSSIQGLLEERINQFVATTTTMTTPDNESSSSSSSLSNDGSVNRWGKFVNPAQEFADEVKVLAVGGIVLLLGASATLIASSSSSGDNNLINAASSLTTLLQGFSSAFQNALQDPQQAVDQMVNTVQEMGPLGPLYYVATYVAFEVLALPVVFVLTSSAGFLFGVTQGTLLALTSAGIAASISFYLGRTVLRGPVERWLEDLPQFRKLDRAIVSQGLQITILERLSPFFPFALSSYVYGATAIDFGSFLLGTLVGFAPGTFAYVYSGVAGKALLMQDAGDATTPWYYYAGGLVVLAALLNVLANVVTGMIAEIEDAADEK